MTTFTREDYEMAAKAAGVDGWYEPGYLSFIKRGGGVWRPPEDDGDALRLARFLRMTIVYEPSRGGWSVGAVVNGAFVWLAHDDDQRSAIFRAATAIGRAMP